MLTFGSIMNGAFRHFRERPLAVLVWGVLNAVVTLGYTLVMVPMLVDRTADLAPGSPQASMAAVGAMLPFYLVIMLLSLVLIGASLRTLLRPGEDSFAGLRLGMDELRLLGLFLLLGVAITIASVIGLLVAGALGGVLALALGGRGAFGWALLPMLVFYAALIFFMVRLSLVSTLTILRRKIIIGESWRLTRGHFWKLFGAYFVLGAMLIVLYLIIATITVGPVFMQMFSHGFSPQGMQAANAMQLQRLSGFSLVTIVSAVGNGLLAALSYGVWSGAAATAVQDLIGRTDIDLAETFA